VTVSLSRALGSLVLAVALAAVLAAPAGAASSGPVWQRVADPAPGTQQHGATPHFPGTLIHLTVANGTPYLFSASDTNGHLVAYRPGPFGTAWHAVGPALNTNEIDSKFRFDVTQAGGVPWATWTEPDDQGVEQVHVARLVGGRFKEVVGGSAPINRPGQGDATYPKIAVLDGRPWVTYLEGSPDLDNQSKFQVARLASDGKSFEHMTTGLPDVRAQSPDLAVASGRLYLAYGSGGTPMARFDAANDQWQPIPSPDQGNWIVDVGGVLHVASAGGQLWRLNEDGGFTELPPSGRGWEHVGAGDNVFYGAEGVATGPGPRLTAFFRGSWRTLPSPYLDRYRYPSPVDLTGTRDALWLLWEDSYDGPYTIHVARYGKRVEPRTWGDGTPSQRYGACPFRLLGSAGDDRIVGTSAPERIFGAGGRDQIFGNGGADCLFGGKGRDRLRGGAGNDRISGGSAGDTIWGGSGRDRLNGGSGRDYIDAVDDSADRIDCGSGKDAAFVDPQDHVRHCEKVGVGL
jgi:hypothetical protein